MTANFIASALINHLSRAAAEESKTHADSRIIVYTRAAKRLFVIGTLIGAFAFSMAVSSMPEDRRMELACILGIILLLPIALGGAEVFLTRITFDDMQIYASAPWRGRRHIPWAAVTECVVAEAEHYAILHTRGYGKIKINAFMRGASELIDQTMLRIYAQAEAAKREVGVHADIGGPPELAVTVVGSKESLAKLVGGFLMFFGVAAMLYSAFMGGTKPSDYATISGEISDVHQTAYNGAKRLNLSLWDPAAGPLRPGLVRPERFFTFKDYPDDFPERDFLQSVRKGMSITLTVPTADADKIKASGAPMSLPVAIVAVQAGDKEYYSLSQYLAAQKRDRFLYMLFGTGAVIAGATAWLFKRRKKIY